MQGCRDAWVPAKKRELAACKTLGPSKQAKADCAAPKRCGRRRREPELVQSTAQLLRTAQEHRWCAYGSLSNAVHTADSANLQHKWLAAA